MIPRVVLPEQATGYGISVRRWRRIDVVELDRAITDSAEHLRRWMAWARDEPRTVEQRLAVLERWEGQWDSGEDAHFAVLDDQQAVVGACGLRQRDVAGTLEIWYWTHAAFLRQGFATRAARLLTDLAFGLPATSYVEIHHDKANRASRGVPLRLGYEFIAERPEDRSVPAEIGVDCTWRMSRQSWTRKLD